MENAINYLKQKKGQMCTEITNTERFTWGFCILVKMYKSTIYKK